MSEGAQIQRHTVLLYVNALKINLDTHIKIPDVNYKLYRCGAAGCSNRRNKRVMIDIVSLVTA